MISSLLSKAFLSAFLGLESNDDSGLGFGNVFNYYIFLFYSSDYQYWA